MAKKAGELFAKAELPLGDGTQTPEQFVRMQSATTGLPEHMCRFNMEKNNFVLGNMDKILDALTRGLDLMEWTFDPLQLKNAYFNIARLGAIVRRYLVNEYGNTSSPLDGGLPSDRCVAEWWMASRHVEAILSHTAPPPSRLRIEERIPLPADLDRIRGEDPERARDIQRLTAARFHSAFSQGLAVTGFERGAAEAAYLLGQWP